MRLGARLDAVADDVLSGAREGALVRLTEFYKAAYTEGYDDGRRDGHDEGYSDAERAFSEESE